MQAGPQKALELSAELSEDKSNTEAKKEAVLSLENLNIPTPLEKKLHYYHQQMQIDR